MNGEDIKSAWKTEQRKLKRFENTNNQQTLLNLREDNKISSVSLRNIKQHNVLSDKRFFKKEENSNLIDSTVYIFQFRIFLM